jgi:hypothetical protein
MMQVEPGIAVKRKERIRLGGRAHRRDRDNGRQQQEEAAGHNGRLILPGLERDSSPHYSRRLRVRS